MNILAAARNVLETSRFQRIPPKAPATDATAVGATPSALPKFVVHAYWYVPMLVTCEIHAPDAESACAWAVERAKAGYFPAKAVWDAAGSTFVHTCHGPDGPAIVAERFTQRLQA